MKQNQNNEKAQNKQTKEIQQNHPKFTSSNIYIFYLLNFC